MEKSKPPIGVQKHGGGPAEPSHPVNLDHKNKRRELAQEKRGAFTHPSMGVRNTNINHQCVRKQKMVWLGAVMHLSAGYTTFGWPFLAFFGG